MKSEIQQVKSFNFTKTSCNSGFENVIIQLWVVKYHKKCLYGLYSFADAARTPHGDGNAALCDNLSLYARCSPHPSRGRQQQSRCSW